MKTVKVFFLLAAGLMVFVAATVIRAGYDVGDNVSEFRLKNTDGKMISLSDFKSEKGVIVIFDCNTCPFSKAYNERIVALNKKYSSQGFPVVAINANDPEKSPGDSFNDMVVQAKKNHYDFPYLVDETQAVARAFGATNTPHVFVLKKDGDNFVVAYIGAIDNNAHNAANADKRYVEEAVESILQNKPLSTTKTKAIGCGIKWKNV